MGVFSEMGNAHGASQLGAIPKCGDAYSILQNSEYENMGDVNWKTGETWGILFSGAIVGVAALYLFNRYYR